MGRTKEGWEELRNTLYQVWEEGRRSLSVHPWAVVALALSVTVLVSGHLIQVFPSLAPVAAGAPFRVYLHGSSPLALVLILLAAYRLGLLAAAVAGLWFFVLHLPFAILLYPDYLIPLAGLILEGMAGFFGIWLIGLLRRAQWTTEQRQREVTAHAAQQVGLLNERIDLLDKVSRQEQRLTHFYRMIVLASQAETVMEILREFLRLIQEDVEAEYASLQLVNSDGTLGERAETFRGMEPIKVWAYPRGIEEQILRTGEALDIADARADPRANPALVQAGIRSYLGIPAKVQERLTVILLVCSTRPAAFEQQRDFLETVCGVAGMLRMGCLSHKAEG